MIIIVITATPSSGYHFDHWVIDGSNNTTANPTVTMTQAHSAHAFFVQTTHSVTFYYQDYYNTNLQLPITIDGNTYYAYGYIGNTYTLSEGSHTITYRSQCAWSNWISMYKDSSYLTSSQSVTINITSDCSFTGVYLS